MSVDYRPDYDPADVDSDYGHTGGDITVPTFTGDTRPFRFWCQKALPLVYDDSLSYYEVLCKMADYMNNFMTDLTTVKDSMTEFGQQFVINQQFLNSMADQLGQNVADLEAYINDRMDDFMTAYTQLQTYVNNYFDNLDVQQEINTKLDEMASDGTLNDLFDPVLETWMQQKTAQIDASIAGQDAIQAAQNARISVLEGRMDTFSGLPSGSTSGNAELLDIRTNFLGETYPTAGDAVRASDMIASGFQSIGFSRLTEWNGNESDSRFDTIQIDVTAYKGGHMVVIANTYQFVANIENANGIELFGSNVAGKTVDSNAHQYPFPDGISGIPSPVFKDFTVLTTSVQDEERILIQLAIPEDFQYQYLKLGNVAPIPGEGYSYTQPAAIVYANSWSKTQVDPTLTIAGDAADAKAAGDAIDELNERLDDVTEETRNLFFGGFANGNIDANGTEYTEPNNYLRCVEFIPVSASTAYTLQVWTASSFSQIVLVEYTENKTVAMRRGITTSSTPLTYRQQSFTTGQTTAYVKFILYSVNDISPNGNRAQIELGTIGTEYIGYHTSAIDRLIRSKFNDNGYMNSSALANESIDILKTLNIFDYDYQYIRLDDVVVGKFYADNGTIQNSTSSAIVPYGIPVKAGKTYNYRGLYNRCCLYIDSNNNITFFSDTVTYVDGSITPSSDGYVYITIPYNSTNGINRNAMFCNGDLPQGRVEGAYNVSVINGDVTKENIITVSLDGTKDFTSIKDAIDSITDASEKNRYTIQIYEGTYDIKSYYTNEQWAVESTAFIGLSVPDFVTLEGIGDRDKVILTATDETKRNYISTLNLRSVCSLKNLTVKSDGLRYAVHDDYSTNSAKGYRYIENCIFEQVNGFYTQAYGAGFHDNDTIVMKNCICNTDADGYSISFHNNTDFVSGSNLEFENCRFGQTGINFITIADGAENNVMLKGTKAQSLVLNRQTSNTGIMFKVTGYANDITNVSVSIGSASDYVDLI